MRPFLLYFSIAFLVFYQQITGAATFFFSWDASAQSFAWLSKIERALLSGQLPLWDFATDSGTSFIGEMQTGAFYPPTWVMSVLPPYQSRLKFEIFLVLHFVWAALGMHLLLKNFQLNKYAVFIGALLFAFVGPAAHRVFGQPNLHAGVVQIPWMVLYAMKGALAQETRRTLWFYSVCAFFAAMAILAGHMHAFIHGLLAAALVIPFVAHPQTVKKIFLFIPVFPFAIIIAAIQFIPSYEYFQLAHKWYGSGYTAYPHVVPFSEFGRYVLQSYCSLLPFHNNCLRPEGAELFFTYSGYLLFLISLYCLRSKLNNNYAYFFCLLSISLLIATAGNNLTGQVVYNIPILNIVRVPVRALHLYSLALAGLMAFGFQVLSQLRTVKNKIFINFLLIAIFSTLLFEVYFYTQSRFVKSANIQISAREYYRPNPVIDFLENRNNQEQGRYRYANIPNSILPPNLGHVYNVHSISSHKSSKLADYHKFLSKNWNYFSDYYDQLALKYIVSNQDIPNLKLLKKFGEIKVYKKQKTLPAFYFSLSDKKLPIPKRSKVIWKENSVRVEFPSKYRPPMGRIFFSQFNYPGWKVKVNDQFTDLLEQQFLSVQSQPEMRSIEFVYSPKSFFLGAIISLIGLVVLIALFVRQWIKP